MKKISVLILLAAIFFPIVSHAVLMVPSVKIIIIGNAVGGDDAFDFRLSDTKPAHNFIQDFSISTTNGIGTTSYNVAFTNEFYLIEKDKPGWMVSSIICVSDSGAAYSSPLSFEGQGRLLIVPAFTTITCTFTNKVKNDKKPVLIIPGILGTTLLKGNDELWLNVRKTVFSPSDSFMDPLSFNKDLGSIDTSISPGIVIRKIDPLGNFKEFDYTSSLINLFLANGYTENQNLFTFPYDWRYGVSEGVVGELKAKVDAIRSQTGSDKVDVVAHSTGGLIVKRYAMETADPHIGKAVFVGVPNLGAPKALKVMISGDNFGVVGLNDEEMKKIAQNMPITYDLSPSKQYFDKTSSYVKIAYRDLLNLHTTRTELLDFDQISNFLINDHGVNSQGLVNSHNLHTSEYDNYDLRTKNIDAYNIVGCKSGTIGRIVEDRFTNILGQKITTPQDPQETNGDGTVPFYSALNFPVDPSHIYYAIKAEHGKMPSQNGIRQTIVNLLAGTNLDAGNKIITQQQLEQNPSLCKLKGDFLQMHSPVSITVTDAEGNISGIAEDGSIQNEIPGADYQIWGDHKLVYLPTDENQQYNIQLAGTGNGTFTFKNQAIQDDLVSQTEVFSNVPVTTDLKGYVYLSGNQSILQLDTNGDGTVDKTVAPTAVIDASKSQDIIPPISTTTITGIIGQPGYYRNDVAVSISAIDPVLSGQENETSGMLKTQYDLDNNGFIDLATITPILITTEGPHTLQFFSTDNAGNNEPVQSIEFTIDKTSPELNWQFNHVLKDLIFKGTDNISTTSQVTVIDNDNIITATDQAGNTTALTLKDKNRKHILKAEIESLSYNNLSADVSGNKMLFVWVFDKSNTLKFLTQTVRVKSEFNVSVIYNGIDTLFLSKDKNGDVVKTLPGLVPITVFTKQGELGWSITPLPL